MGEPPICLRLLADDLSGALDSTARFVPITGPVPVVWSDRITTGTVAIDTGTRDVSVDTARSAVTKFAPLLAGGDPAFKKIDSLLRGHVAAELAACMAHFDHCVLAPAFPFQGRITRNGRQLVRNGSGWCDTGVDLASALRAEGLALPIRDAATDADLDAIVTEWRQLPGRILWCGTGGLAGVLAGRRAVPRPPLARPILALIGTDHPVTAAQLARVAALHCRLPADTQEITRLLQNGAAAVSVTLPPGTPRAIACRCIVAAFAALLGTIERPGSLLVTGGETLRGLSDALGATRLEVDGEIEPGAPIALLRGGAWDGQRIVSKSGAFGVPDFLARLFAV